MRRLRLQVYREIKDQDDQQEQIPASPRAIPVLRNSVSQVLPDDGTDSLQIGRRMDG
jgi:hypothetical protein